MLCQAILTQMPSIFDPNRTVTAIRMVVSSADIGHIGTISSFDVLTMFAGTRPFQNGSVMLLHIAPLYCGEMTSTPFNPFKTRSDRSKREITLWRPTLLS